MKKLILLGILLATSFVGKAQNITSTKQGTVLEVEAKNNQIFTGKLIDNETHEVSFFIAHRPVEVNELVIFVTNAESRKSLQDESKGFSSLIR